MNIDSGAPGDDLSTGGGGTGGRDMAGAKGDMTGVGDGGEFDTTGPTITIAAPTVGSFVKGVFTISATISDPSGVDPASVLAEFGNDNSTDITLTSAGSNTYSGVFDVAALINSKNLVLAEISVRAKDGIGNQSQLGEVVVIDTVRPLMTMDAGKSMWVGKPDTTTPTNVDCSQPFSPLGSDAAHEGQVVQQLVTLRTRIEDDGNHANGLAVVRVSLIDESSVQMFVIHDDGQTPLAVDTDGDANHYCDDVNPLLIPTAGPVVMQNEALSLQLAPMPITGTPNYAGTGTAPSQCTRIGDGTTATPPKAICTDTLMTYVKGYSSPPKPAIWTLPPIKAGDPVDCSGFQLDAANQLPEGPACVITRAVDNAGNVEVSFPLHICIDLGNHMCDTYSPTASHCTGIYDKATMTLKPGNCIEPLPEASAPQNGPATFPQNDFQFLPN